jgi:hypothetical protein
VQLNETKNKIATKNDKKIDGIKLKVILIVLSRNDVLPKIA